MSDMTANPTSEHETLEAELTPDGARLSGELSHTTRLMSFDDLLDKPTINGHVLSEGLLGVDLDLVTFDARTTAEWSEDPTSVSQENVLYIYTDYETVTKDGVNYNVAGFKLGDGMAYIVDLPFLTTKYDSHVANTTSHITQSEREFWNNKCRPVVDNETLILTIL